MPSGETVTDTPPQATATVGTPTVEQLAVSPEMARAWNSYSTRIKVLLEELKDQEGDWTLPEFKAYLREYRRLKQSTIGKRLSQLSFMEDHGVFPVQLHKGAHQLVTSFWLYVQHREKVENVGHGGLVNDHKAIRSLGDYLAIPREVWPTAPTAPMTDERFIPPPEQVHALLHADYFPNPAVSYDNALVKGILAFDFLIGARCPSEAHALALADFMPDRHRIIVTEPKKTGRRRTLGLEPKWICCSTRRPSLGNYVRYWRPKAAAKADADPDDPEAAPKLFIRSDGTPFPSKESLAKFVNDAVKPKFPWFYPYLGRHWSVTARLIEWDFDYSRVADWHGHEDVKMTRREYEHNARLLKEEHGDEWIRRAGRAPRRPNGFRNENGEARP